MKNGEWVKIGEVVKPWFAFYRGIYARYAVMELVCDNGMRKYKEVYMCSWEHSESVKSQPQL